VFMLIYANTASYPFTPQPRVVFSDDPYKVLEESMAEAGESNRSKRGAMSVARFRHIASLV
jgi:hypothetical protein